MASILKLIWRFDFEPSYDFLNRKGDALRALLEEVPDFLPTTKFTDQSGVAGEGSDDESRRNITMDVKALSGTIDFMTDVPMHAVFETSSFRSADKITKQLTQIGKLQHLKRGGMRFFILSPDPSPRTFVSVVSQESLEFSDKALGAVTDVAAVIEGADGDGLSYRLQYGQYMQKNADLLFASPLPGHVIDKAKESWTIVDLDVYETDFSLVSPSLFRWASTKLAKAEKLTILLSGHGEH